LSGLDDKSLGLLSEADAPPLSEPNLAFQPVTLMFLPDEPERVLETFRSAMTMLPKQPTWLARMSEYDRALEAIDAASKAHDVRNVATSLLLVLDVFERHLTDLQAGYMDDEEPKHKGWVPLASVVGTYNVPASVAILLTRAISRMVDAGEVSDKARWQALEYWAAESLAS
jgi:hypothetical protein